MSLLDAQKKNIEADTNLKEADANKTSGVDTDEKKVTIDNIIAQTKNEETKNKLMEVQTNLLKIQEAESNMSREDRMYEIKMRMRKTTEEVRQLSRNNEIGEETKNEIVEQIKLQTIGARLDNELKKANINLTKAQIHSLIENVRIGWFGAANKLREMSQKDKELQISEFNAKVDAIYKGASTVLGRVANDIIHDVSSEVDNELK